MKIPNRITDEARVLSGYKTGEHVTFRLDHIGWLLLPFALWYEPMSAWYDIADLLLGAFVYGFILIVYIVAGLMLWVMGQSFEWLNRRYPDAIVETDSTGPWLPTIGWLERPDMIVSCVAAYIGWMIALLQEDMITMSILFTIGCMMYPTFGYLSRVTVKRWKKEGNL